MSETPDCHTNIQEVKWTAETNPGRFRPNNEDAFLLVKFDLQELEYLGKVGESPTESNQFIFAVSDGIGGAEAGEYASQSALKSISKLISRKFHQVQKIHTNQSPGTTNSFLRRNPQHHHRNLPLLSGMPQYGCDP